MSGVGSKLKTRSESKCGEAGKGSWERGGLTEPMFPEVTCAVALDGGGT